MRAETVPASPADFCPACGHSNGGGEHRCQKCGRRLSVSFGNSGEPLRGASGAGAVRILGPRRAEGKAGSPGNSRAEVRRRGPAFPELLRRQLSAQVREFQNRRLRPTLPFSAAEESKAAEKVVPIAGPAAPPARTQDATERSAGVSQSESRRSRVRAELQTPLEFPGPPPGSSPNPGCATVVAAPFRLRALGHSLDLAWILAGFLVLAAPVKLLVGDLVYNRFLLAAGLASGFGVALLYGILFLYLAGATPAMKCLGLRLVNFDGLPASRPERLWRLLGAVASAGSFLLGFAWAAVDEETFSWHDRISKTVLTAANR